MSKQQDKIKSYLHMLGMEQQFNQTSYTRRQPPSRHGFSVQQLTDWNNKKLLSKELFSPSPSFPKLRNQKNLITSRCNSMDMTSYHSSLLKDLQNRKKEESMFINPVVIKFNTQVCKNTLRRSQLLFHKILHEDGQKKGQQPSKLRQMLRRIKPNAKETEDSQSGALSPPPKTERCSGILRMLKRRQQIRIMKKKKQNPEALTAIKLQSK